MIVVAIVIDLRIRRTVEFHDWLAHTTGRASNWVEFQEVARSDIGRRTSPSRSTHSVG